MHVLVKGQGLVVRESWWCLIRPTGQMLPDTPVTLDKACSCFVSIFGPWAHPQSAIRRWVALPSLQCRAHPWGSVEWTRWWTTGLKQWHFNREMGHLTCLLKISAILLIKSVMYVQRGDEIFLSHVYCHSCQEFGHSFCVFAVNGDIVIAGWACINFFSYSTLVLWNYMEAMRKDRGRCKNNAEEIFFCFAVSLAYRRPSLCELRWPCLYICAVCDRNSGTEK